DGDIPLLWVLRDVLGMTGTKFGCGRALCGACTVHLNGMPLRSCVMPVANVGESAVTTIEAIGETPIGQSLQKAWLDLEVVQCGYCQSGQIMSAAALLAANSQPTDTDIDTAMAGNICRCGTYVRIREAIKQAAQLSATPAVRGGCHAVATLERWRSRGGPFAGPLSANLLARKCRSGGRIAGGLHFPAAHKNGSSRRGGGLRTERIHTHRSRRSSDHHC